MTAPQQSPGGQREDTAVAIGARVGAVMAAAQLALLAVVAAAVVKLLAGGNRRSLARQVHAAAASTVQEAVARAEQILADAEQRIVDETTTALNESAPSGTPRFGAPTAAQPEPPAPSRPTAPSSPRPEPTEPARSVTRSHPVSEPPKTRQAIAALPAGRTWPSVEQSVRDAGLNAIRETDDAFARAASEATANHATGTRAAQKMLDRLAEQGISVFTDKNGREWDLAAYCEMAVRTAATRLALLTQLGLMGPAGMDLVIVDAPSGELGCRKCSPFEGRVLSLAGKHHVGQAVTAKDVYGVLKSTLVVATLSDAVAAGLLHPNCRHFLTPWVDGAHLPIVGARRGFIPGGSPLYRVVIPQHDSASYRAQQKQRALEREVRAAARRQSVALTPLTRAQARRELAAARSNLEQHVAAHHLTRLRYREHPTKAR